MVSAPGLVSSSLNIQFILTPLGVAMKVRVFIYVYYDCLLFLFISFCHIQLYSSVYRLFGWRVLHIGFS